MNTKLRNPESHLLAAIRLALGREPDLVLWRNAAGVAIHAQTGNTQKFGLAAGATDLIGILTVGRVGVFVAIEVKTATGRLTREQELFGALVSRRGGVYGVARSVPDAIGIIERARDTLRLQVVVDDAGNR